MAGGLIRSRLDHAQSMAGASAVARLFDRLCDRDSVGPCELQKLAAMAELTRVVRRRLAQPTHARDTQPGSMDFARDEVLDQSDHVNQRDVALLSDAAC
jgi:hypothetical protein